MKTLKTIVAVKTIKGTSFVAVRNYENSSSELSNQTFLVGFDYGKMLLNDLQTLKELNFDAITEKYSDNKEIVLKAYNELLTSLEKRTADEKTKQLLLNQNDSTMNRSLAQSDAYINISKGLKAKADENGLLSLYIFGLCVKKTVLKQGLYKEVKSQLKTIIKNEISKLANLRESKYKQFKLGSTETLSLQGITI